MGDPPNQPKAARPQTGRPLKAKPNVKVPCSKESLRANLTPLVATEPNPLAFGLTPNDVARLQAHLDFLEGRQAGPAESQTRPSEAKKWLQGAGAMLFLLTAPVSLPVAAGVLPLVAKVRRARLERDPLYPRFALYREACVAAEKAKKEALADARRREERFWLVLSGWEFERQLATLFERAGFAAELTRGSGDKGIDIFVSTFKRSFVAQCKQHKKPVGPATVRELIGAASSVRASGAILACTSGFTNGARQAAKGSRVFILDLQAIVALARFAAQTGDEPPDIVRWLRAATHIPQGNLNPTV